MDEQLFQRQVCAISRELSQSFNSTEIPCTWSANLENLIPMQLFWSEKSKFLQPSHGTGVGRLNIQLRRPMRGHYILAEA